MSSRTIRGLALTFTLVPAAFLLHTGAATAADAQEHAGALLQSAPAAAVSAPADAQRSARTIDPAVDAQYLARRLLLGGAGRSGKREVSAPVASASRGHGDAQLLAQQVLRAHRGAPTVRS